MDTLAAMPHGAMSSPAAQRNATAILAVLAAHLPATGRVLEVASGSGEHAVAFARALPGIDWTPSDPSPEARASIRAWAADHDIDTGSGSGSGLGPGAGALRAPLDLDAADPATWPGTPGAFDAVVCINMIHISPWAATQGMMIGAASVLAKPGGLLVLYGPFTEADQPTVPSNLAFDADLKGRDPAWGLRDRDAVVALARARGLSLTRRVEMPANNLMLLFRRV